MIRIWVLSKRLIYIKWLSHKGDGFGKEKKLIATHLSTMQLFLNMASSKNVKHVWRSTPFMGITNQSKFYLRFPFTCLVSIDLLKGRTQEKKLIVLHLF